MNSWKTTLFGLVSAIGGGILGAYILKPELLAGFPSWLPGIGVLFSSIGTAGLGLSARDNDKSSEDVGAKDPTTKIIPKITALLFICGLALSFSACSNLHSKTIKSTDSSGVATEKTTVWAYTFWDSQSALAKFRNTTGGLGTNGFVIPSGTSIDSLNQQASGTNATDLATAVVGAAIKAAIKP